jgi:hypothetical protein
MLPIHFNTDNLLLIIYFFRFIFCLSFEMNANSLKAADQWLTSERNYMQKKARLHNKVVEISYIPIPISTIFLIDMLQVSVVKRFHIQFLGSKIGSKWFSNIVFFFVELTS